MNKLTTTAEVLQHMREVGGRNWRHATAETYAADTATATYLAECVRLRQAFEKWERTLIPQSLEASQRHTFRLPEALRAALDEVK